MDREPRAGHVAVGRVLRPWGLRGDVKVESLTDFPDRFEPGKELWLDGVCHVVEHARWQKGALYLKLSGIGDTTAAEAARDRLLEVPESALRALDEDEFYHHQLVGLDVHTEDGAALGRVGEVLPTGGNAVLVVRGPRGELLLPFIDDVVRTVNLAAGTVVVELMEGLGEESRPAARHRRQPRRRGAANR